MPAIHVAVQRGTECCVAEEVLEREIAERRLAVSVVGVGVAVQRVGRRDDGHIFERRWIGGPPVDAELLEEAGRALAAKVRRADEILERCRPALVHEGVAALVDPHPERHVRVRDLVLGHEAREDRVGVRLVVRHHGILHAGETLHDRRLLVRVRNAGPVVREPVERVAAVLHHVMVVGRSIVVCRLHARASARGVVHDDAAGVPDVMVAEIEGDVRDVARREVPTVHRTVLGDAPRRHLVARRHADRGVRCERLLEALKRRGLEHCRGIDQRACAPDHEVGRHLQRDVVIVEVTVELLRVREGDRVPAVVVVVDGDARIEVGEEPGRGVDHPLAPALARDLVVPVEGQAHRVARTERCGELDALDGERCGIVGPRLRRAIHGEGIDMHPRREIVRVGAGISRRARLVDVEEEPEHQVAQRVRAVVRVGDLLRAAHGPVGRQRRHRDRVAPAVLPVVRARPAVARPSAVAISIGNGARHRKPCVVWLSTQCLPLRLACWSALRDDPASRRDERQESQEEHRPECDATRRGARMGSDEL